MPSQYPSIQSFFRKEVRGGEGASALDVMREQKGGNEDRMGGGFGRDGGGEIDGVERDGKDELGDGFTVSTYKRLTGLTRLIDFMQFFLILTFLSC